MKIFPEELSDKFKNFCIARQEYCKVFDLPWYKKDYINEFFIYIKQKYNEKDIRAVSILDFLLEKYPFSEREKFLIEAEKNFYSLYKEWPEKDKAEKRDNPLITTYVWEGVIK